MALGVPAPGAVGGWSQPCLELGRLCGVPLHPGGPEPLTPLACSVFTGWVRMSTQPRAQGGTGSRCSDTPAAVQPCRPHTRPRRLGVCPPVPVSSSALPSGSCLFP